jgi:hypothetical protein
MLARGDDKGAGRLVAAVNLGLEQVDQDVALEQREDGAVLALAADVHAHRHDALLGVAVDQDAVDDAVREERERVRGVVPVAPEVALDELRGAVGSDAASSACCDWKVLSVMRDSRK